MIDHILCLQCNRCLNIVIDYEHYLFIMRSFFFGTCCWNVTDNMGGGGGGGGEGGGDWLHPMFPFLLFYPL